MSYPRTSIWLLRKEMRMASIGLPKFVAGQNSAIGLPPFCD